MAAIIQAKFRRLADLIYETFQMLGYDIRNRTRMFESFGLDYSRDLEIGDLPVIAELAKTLMNRYLPHWDEFSQLLGDLDPVLQESLKNPDFDITFFTSKDYLTLTHLPDDFYEDLQKQINRAYRTGIFPAVQILSRKFLENLIVDILRKKFGNTPGNLELFYNKNNGQYLSFRRLLENLESKLNEFQGICQGFDQNLLREIKKFKEQANGSAHTLEINRTREVLDAEAGILEHIIKVLIRVLNAI